MSEGDEHFLARWSRRKREAKHASVEPPAPSEPTDRSAHPAVPPPAVPVETPPADSQPPQPQPLPPVESLTPESDFTPFMQAEVDPGVRRQALKTLFQDPHFNVMDGLDVYIDDYSKPDPLPEGWLEKMTQVARLGAYVEPVAAAEAEPVAASEAEPVAVAENEAVEALAENAPAPLAEPPALAAERAAEGEAESPERARETAATQEPEPGPIRKTTDDS